MKLVELYKKVQAIPYKVCRYDESEIDENLEHGDCRHKAFLLKTLLEKEGFDVRKISATFDWRDLPLPEEMLNILRSGTIWDHTLLEVKTNDRWIKVDCTWNPELKEKGFPVTEDWDGKSDTKQVTEGKLEFHYKDYKKIKVNKEEASRFADALNDYLGS
jgi:hypothetical protein